MINKKRILTYCIVLLMLIVSLSSAMARIDLTNTQFGGTTNILTNNYYNYTNYTNTFNQSLNTTDSVNFSYLDVDNDVNISGILNVTGKINAGGGVDPPYILFNREDLFGILTRINKEIPQDQIKKWGGQVMYYDADIDNMCTLNPATGEVRQFVWKEDFDKLESRVDMLEKQIQELIGGR